MGRFWDRDPQLVLYIKLVYKKTEYRPSVAHISVKVIMLQIYKSYFDHVINHPLGPPSI